MDESVELEQVDASGLPLVEIPRMDMLPKKNHRQAHIEDAAMTVPPRMRSILNPKDLPSF
ncbi:hypothetical protein Y981_05510 [Leptospirillum ferriphilum YSK]|uniref:Uncharacterized protein n=1 Tax=Leptospirillum ferriphilum YSK TaxID=1441628 RepID=A0A059XXQ7_9BACT|nr:hypothetical protein Y981_05510 [Leptospirillum ferriphilum YSK]